MKATRGFKSKRAAVAIEIYKTGWPENPERALREQYAAYLTRVCNAAKAMSFEEWRQSKGSDE